MTHDRQRQRVYDAEQRVCDQLDFAARGARAVTVHGSTVTVTGDTRFGSLAHVQAWLDRLRARAWFAARWPAAASTPLVARSRRGRTRAHYEPHGSHGVIAVPVPGNTTGWAMREMVLAHEAAHHVMACALAPATGGQDVAGAVAGDALDARAVSHGPAFAGAMLELVGRELGVETRLLLTAAYHDGGVDVASPPGAASPTGASSPRDDSPGASRSGAIP